MTARITQKEVETEFTKRGCELLDKYTNNHTPLRFRCRCGGITTISYKSFGRGSYCLNCSGKAKKTYKEVKKYIESEGYKLVDSKYQNAFHEMTTICPYGHMYKTHWNNFQQGRRCLQCKPQKVAAAIRLDYEQVKQEFESFGCVLLSDKYESIHKPVNFICSCGRKGKIRLANLRNGHRCRSCGVRRGENHPGWIKDRKEAELRRTITTKCFSALRCALRATGQNKNLKSYKLLKYTVAELKEHITNHHNWPKVKNKVWHLDHIFPIKAFCDYKITDLSLINCLENLQPLQGRENLRKSGKYSKSEFETWLRAKGAL